MLKLVRDITSWDQIRPDYIFSDISQFWLTCLDQSLASENIRFIIISVNRGSSWHNHLVSWEDS